MAPRLGLGQRTGGQQVREHICQRHIDQVQAQVGSAHRHQPHLAESGCDLVLVWFQTLSERLQLQEPLPIVIETAKSVR